MRMNYQFNPDMVRYEFLFEKMTDEEYVEVYKTLWEHPHVKPVHNDDKLIVAFTDDVDTADFILSRYGASFEGDPLLSRWIKASSRCQKKVPTEPSKLEEEVK